MARKSILAQLNDAVQTIADELAKPDVKPAKANLLIARVDTLRYMHQQEVAAEQDALAKENADLRRQLAELKAPTSPATTSQSELDDVVRGMLERHACQPTTSKTATVTSVPTMTRCERLTPAPVEDDTDFVT